MLVRLLFFFFNDTATTEIYTLSLHDALPIFVQWVELGRLSDERRPRGDRRRGERRGVAPVLRDHRPRRPHARSEEHTSELQSRLHLVCRLLLEKNKIMIDIAALLQQKSVVSV